MPIRLTPIVAQMNSKNSAMNCGPLSVSKEFGIQQRNTQLDMNTDATWAEVAYDIATTHALFE